MKANKSSRYFFRTLFFLFIIFVALLIAYESGYYETKMSNKAIMTKEAMEQFEKDVANNEAVDLKDYLIDDKKDYSNTVTKIGNKITNSLSAIFTKGLTGVFNTLKGLFW